LENETTWRHNIQIGIFSEGVTKKLLNVMGRYRQ